MIQDVKLTGDRKTRGIKPRNSSDHLRRTHIPDTVIILIDHEDASVRNTGIMENTKVLGILCQYGEAEVGRIRQVVTVLGSNHVYVAWTDYLISGSNEPQPVLIAVGGVIEIEPQAHVDNLSRSANVSPPPLPRR